MKACWNIQTSVYVKCFFNKTHHWLWPSLFSYPLFSIGVNVLLYILCNCLCSIYAAHAWGSIFFYVFRFVFTHHRQYITLFVTLCILPWGIKEWSINPFLRFRRILRRICESGWHQEEWTPAVWYLQQGSESIMKPFVGITVIAH